MATNQVQPTPNYASAADTPAASLADNLEGCRSIKAEQLNRPMLVVQNLPQAGKCHQPSLTKAELAEILCGQIGLNKREAAGMVESFFEEISNALERGEMVKLTGFGNFQVRDKTPRPGRNLKIGELVMIPARRVVTFQASQKIKKTIDDNRK